MFSLSYWARFYFADSRGNSWIFTAQLAWALDFPVVQEVYPNVQTQFTEA